MSTFSWPWIVTVLAASWMSTIWQPSPLAVRQEMPVQPSVRAAPHMYTVPVINLDSSYPSAMVAPGLSVMAALCAAALPFTVVLAM